MTLRVWPDASNMVVMLLELRKSPSRYIAFSIIFPASMGSTEMKFSWMSRQTRSATSDPSSARSVTSDAMDSIFSRHFFFYYTNINF